MTYAIGPKLTLNQKMVLYGTILGGSSIIKPARGKNCYLAMRDCNINWLSYKTNELKQLFKIDDMLIKKDKSTHRCYSIAYPVFNELYDLFYENGKKVIRNQLLDELNDVAWMVWFVDAGRKTKRKAYLRTHKFGKEGTEAICNYFNSVSTECTIRESQGKHELIFSNAGSHRLLKTIVHRIPKFLRNEFA